MTRELLHGAVHHLGRLHHLEKGLEIGMTFPAAFSYITEGMGEVRVTHDERAYQAILDKPVVLVANHPAAAPLVVLPALEHRVRDDVHIMADATLIDYFGPLSQKRLVPTYKRGPGLRRVVSPGTILKAIDRRALKPEEERQRNRQSIERGINIVEQGGLFVIFPTGGDGIAWKTGIGKIIKELVKRGVDFHLVAAYVSDTRQLDNARLIAPRLSRRVLGTFQPTIHFSSVLHESLQAQSKELKDMSAHEIAKRLQRIYEQQSPLSTLEPLFR